MIIRYSNGHETDGVLLSRTDSSMRIATRNSDDVLQLNLVNGAWISEDCEPVQVIFGFAKKEQGPVVSVDGAVCSKKLAAKLLYMLFSGNEDAEAEAAALNAAAAAESHQVV